MNLKIRKRAIHRISVNDCEELDAAIHKHLATLPETVGNAFTTDVRVKVVDEHGIPLEKARVSLEEISDTNGDEPCNEYHIYKKTVVTDCRGMAVFEKVPYYNFFSLSKALGFAGRWPHGNMRATVDKQGFYPMSKDFLSINKVGVAMSLEWHYMIRAAQQRDRERSQKEGGRVRKEYPPFKQWLPFLKENMQKQVELEIVLFPDRTNVPGSR